MKKYAIIVAGGEGNRAGGVVPKQFQLVDGIPMLWWSVRAFHAEDPSTRIILVLHPGFFDEWDLLFADLPESDRKIEVKLVCGGRSRLESVKNGLESVEAEKDVYVAVHDAARPLVDTELIARGWKKAYAEGAAVPVVEMTDSIRKIDGSESRSVPRKDFVKVQTPQVFDATLLKQAYSGELNATMTDDASVVEAFGHRVSLFEGNPDNMKVTNPMDINIATLIIGLRGIH